MTKYLINISEYRGYTIHRYYDGEVQVLFYGELIESFPTVKAAKKQIDDWKDAR